MGSLYRTVINKAEISEVQEINMKRKELLSKIFLAWWIKFKTKILYAMPFCQDILPATCCMWTGEQVNMDWPSRVLISSLLWLCMKPILKPARPKSLLSPHRTWVREGSGNWRGLGVFMEELRAHLVLWDTEDA